MWDQFQLVVVVAVVDNLVVVVVVDIADYHKDFVGFRIDYAVAVGSYLLAGYHRDFAVAVDGDNLFVADSLQHLDNTHPAKIYDVYIILLIFVLGIIQSGI